MRIQFNYLLSNSFILFYLSALRCQRSSKIHRFSRSLSIPETSLKSDYNVFLDLLNPIMIERVVDTPGNKLVREYLTSKMEEYGWVVEQNAFHDDTPYGKKQFVNVIANYPVGLNFNHEKNVSEIKRTQDFSRFHTTNRIVLACHYDSKYETDHEFIGAIDSAVPCALMLDIAKFLHENFDKSTFKKISRHLQFMFFDGEEAFKEWNDKDSIYGARYHAKQLTDKYSQDSFDKIDLFVLLDLIGGTQSKFLNFFPATSNTYRLLSKIETMLLKKGMLNSKKSYYFTNTQGVRGYGGVQDDHLPFLHKNVPILHLIPVPFPKQWHTPDDNFKNLDHKRIEDLRIILKIFTMHILNKSQDSANERMDEEL